MNLTAPQRDALERLVTLKLPASYLANGFPGVPAGNLDMRSVEALQRRGLVECIIHKWRPSSEDRDRYTPTYRATDAGRAEIDPTTDKPWRGR